MAAAVPATKAAVLPGVGPAAGLVRVVAGAIMDVDRRPLHTAARAGPGDGPTPRWLAAVPLAHLYQAPDYVILYWSDEEE